MVLTFFLGNGFDINLGRATRYSNFYDYYKQQPSAYPVVQKLKDDIEEYRDKDWKDLELGLGQFTAKVETVEEFLIAFADITVELTKYLRSEEQTFSLTDPQIVSIRKDFQSPQQELPVVARRNYLNLYPNYETTTINFLTLNYTASLSLIFKNMKDKLHRKDSIYIIGFRRNRPHPSRLEMPGNYPRSR